MVVFKVEEENQEFNQFQENRNKNVTIISLLLVLVPLAIVFYLLIGSRYYVDLTKGCFIKTTYSVHNKEKSVFSDALKYLKQEDNDNYSMVCNYIDEINEDHCIVASQGGPSISHTETSGCYIKGTKRIFIHPQNNYSEKDLAKISESIVEQSTYSKKFHPY